VLEVEELLEVDGWEQDRSLGMMAYLRRRLELEALERKATVHPHGRIGEGGSYSQ
jgi:hypothetical protein